MFKIKPLVLSCAFALMTTSAIVPAQDSSKNDLPEIGAAGSSILSIDKERIVGDAMMRQLRASQPLINDPVLDEYMNHLGNLLVQNAQDVNYKFEFFVIDNKELNAFAFFGGHVGVHSGLITTASTESELASVLAHEVSHVTQRHLARRLEAQSRSQPMTMATMLGGVLLALVNPTVGMATLSASMAASQQAGINYTRGNEKEADRVGIQLLANSNFDPMGAPDFFNKMSEKYRYSTKLPAMLLTHPLPDSRITDARLRAQNYPNRNIAPSLDFELSKSRIKSRYQGNATDNIAYYEDLIKKQKYTLKVAAQYGLALSYFENKESQKALSILTALHKDDPNNLFFVDALSDVYISLKQFEPALKMLSDLNLLMPKNQVVALNYANVLQEAGQLEASSEVLQDFLVIQPGHFIAYDLLTTIYRKLDKKAMMHLSKAEVYALLGAYPRAIDEMQTGYTFTEDKLLQKRIKARILQFKDQQEKLKRL
ncbi:M48 family metalloprotease [Thalassotalea atypica]|uniref:beta-barrel assembly-enhancing protease n=1 Tax=Thalassotalea atypica TaxID=2054316 RepID=UPI002572D844|nr:M48 family metalloprotease [Thalassotalea atypica]